MDFNLTDRKQIAEATMAFTFAPQRPVPFTPGQFAEFTLNKPSRTDAKGNTRVFSIASSPAAQRIMIATRLRDSAFKECLCTLPFGTSVEVSAPMGDFTLHSDPSRPAVFLAGGIGITPVRSIVESALLEGLRHKLVLFYSNRTRASAAFFEELQAWDQRSSNLKFIPILSKETPAEWSGELGAIDEKMLRRHLSDLDAPVYYIVGPPKMVAAMKSLLHELNIDELQIRSEDFGGY